MSDDGQRYKDLDVTPAVHETEWCVRLALPLHVVFLTATEAKDLSQRLFHLALEISEREGTPQGGETVEALRAELRREREKRQELARKVAPKDKLEAAKIAVRVMAEREQLHSKSRNALEAALAWLEEFKA